jgi:hypothetical protein
MFPEAALESAVNEYSMPHAPHFRSISSEASAIGLLSMGDILGTKSAMGLVWTALWQEMCLEAELGDLAGSLEHACEARSRERHSRWPQRFFAAAIEMLLKQNLFRRGNIFKPRESTYVAGANRRRPKQLI